VPGVRVADDLVERRFRPAGPNQRWAADGTTSEVGGLAVLAAVQDAYSRAIVGSSMAEHMRTELVLDALQTAVGRRRPAPGELQSRTAARCRLLGANGTMSRCASYGGSDRGLPSSAL
jgi:transposase InsO family protein